MQSILNHKVSNLDKTVTESPENQIVSLEPSHQLQQRPHSHHRDAPDTSSTPYHTCTEDPAGRDQHGDSLSYKSSACSAGEQKLDKTLQALHETSQEFTDPKLASDCRLSRVSVQNVANSQKFLDETLIEQEPDPNIPIFHSEYPNAKHPVFDIFGWDISEALEVNHLNKLSPPNPLQSQEFDDVLLGKQVLPSLSRDVTRSTSPSVGCDVLELPGTHEKSRLARATEQEPDVLQANEMLHRWQSAPLRDVPHQSLCCVGQNSHKLGPHTRGVAGRTTLFNCSVPLPVSFKYQPMVILTQLPVENVSTPNKCTEQENAKSSASEMVPPTDDTELSYATTWRDSESWMDTCSGDCGSDPDYVPGCF
ncbi:Hypothetical predicted protein [Pelobates cultripes]|uniref:Uncharacterized protein n=1 Tax=Pelobates cultripes TaxID=61616 RepID=A0AAD1TCC7_PELCU|nr:Hypothetical predicted protein [Pelobates cultripes]